LAIHASFRKVPDRAKLVNIGNCFRYPGGNWNIACEFLLPDETKSKITLAVEALPALAIGRIYSKEKIARPSSSLISIDLPPVEQWSIQTLADYEGFTTRNYLPKEYGSQLLFRFSYNRYYIWIPCIELARVLFLKTTLITRAAFYEPNLNRLIDVDIDNSQANIRLHEEYPRNLLDIKAHQSYLAWLTLNPEVTSSYLSIYKSLLEKSVKQPSATAWLFQFEPFDMDNVFIRAHTRTYGKNILVEEITSVARLPMTERFNTVSFHHPLDVKHEKETKSKDNKSSGGKRARETFDPETSDSESPSNLTRAKILDVPKGALYFNEILNTQRVFNIQVIEAGKDDEQVKEEKEIKNKTLSILGGTGQGRHKSADFKTQDDESPSNIGFFNYIRKALSLIKKIEHLSVSEVYEETGLIDAKHVRKFMYIKHPIKRAFLYAQLEIAGGDCIHLIEIDLSDNHRLTTLAFRLQDENSVVTTIQTILDDLVKKSGHWDRDSLQRMTLMHTCINHPKELNDETPDSAFQSWATRIASEF
jgi:hypothetical protein